MKILMIAPEPFFEPRGTPFSEYFRMKALGKLGHSIDLFTYPIGRDKDIPGLRIFRGFKLPFVKAVKTGPSFAKIFLDFFLFFRVLGRVLTKRYDLIHTHEEACIMGAFFSKLTGTPHLYDMHSSLVQQMTNFQFTRSKLVIGFFKMIERISLRNARSVIVICRSLYDYAATITAREKLTVIENFIDESSIHQSENQGQKPGENIDPDRLANIRREIGGGEKKIIMYTGTLEKYQGIPLLIDSMAHLPGDYRLVLIGGKKDQIEEVTKIVREKELADRVMLLGIKEPADIPYYLEASDILVSPRISGTNIPLKIYAYLKSGIPVVVTNLYTHTQSINEEIAILADPDPVKFAAAIAEAASGKGKTAAANAEEFCEKNYTYERYLALVDEAVKKGVKS